eukprot:TRINITY_DN338_c0_g1_i6.p1 TRINITY_DN338_c0_g1~~TRINITY_DN338_c0_g1_i6.p1  ORF type:complete len:429 (-),score=112.03 TRINITY_DN338_c0_g1_i6:45-1331(-)
MEKYDLTSKVGQYLDIHLLLKIVNFYEQKELYPLNEVLQSKIDLLSRTNMVTYTVEMYQKLKNTDEEPEEFSKRKEVLLKTLNSLKSRRFLSLFDDTRQEELEKLVESDQWNIPTLETKYKATKEDFDAIYALAKFYFECGQYPYVSKLLKHFIALNGDKEKRKSALWGKLAAEIVMSNWDEVNKDIKAMEELIETSQDITPLKQLEQRTWLANWILFSMFQKPQNISSTLELFLGNEVYSQVVQTKSPWILRYLSIAVILTKQKLRELVELIEQESFIYSDPITNFVYSLYAKFDFIAAERELALCGDILEKDYFISGTDEVKGIKEDFLKAGKLAICEAFCKIHSTIDIGMMATKLGKSNEESERWIVNLIRNSKLDAKIDSAKNQVLVTSSVPNAHQQLLEKTKSLSVKASLLATNLGRVKSPQQ